MRILNVTFGIAVSGNRVKLPKTLLFDKFKKGGKRNDK